jgi:predicted phage tail protein
MEMNRPRLVSNPHPLIGAGRELSFAEFAERETLKSYIERTGIIVPSGDVAVWHNGYRVPDALWERLIPRTGDQVIIRARVHGGGGGGKVLRTVALIAVVVAATIVAGPAGAAFFASAGFGTGVVAAGVAGALVGIGGALLVNALLPPPKQSLPELANGNKTENNPTYSIAGGSNQSRPWQPMTLVFGRHKVVPDLAAKPYTEYDGDDQYLNQAFHFGLQGTVLSITDLRLGDTPITDFEAVQLQRAATNGKLTLFPTNVDSITGFALNQADGWIERTTPINTNHVRFELATQLYYVADDGSLAFRSAIYEFQYRAVGASTWINIGEYTNPAIYAKFYWSKRSYELVSTGGDSGTEYYQPGGQVEFGTTVFADHTDGEIVTEYDPIDDVDVSYIWVWTPHPYTLKQPWQGIAPDPLLTGATAVSGIKKTNNKTEPLRFSVDVGVPVGQYEVRVRKATGDISNSRQSNVTVVNQILCYQPDTADYTRQARMAVRIKATSQLQGQIQNLTGICSASCPVWTGSAFVTKQTSNPAWWFYWYAKGMNDALGNRIFGGGLTGSQIDLDAIKAWAIFCDQKNLTFNYVLSQRTTVHDVLTMIARAGRAAYTWQTGKLGVVWDAANLPVVAMVGPYNILAGSFNINYVNDSTADEIVMNFINPARNWEQDSVRVTVPNVVANNNTITLDLDGCTNENMAAREANLIAASQAFHRRRVSWEMDVEGMIATRGDVVQFSHDLTVWSYSGRLLSGDRSTLKLAQTVPSDGSGWLSLRAPDGTMQLIQVTSAAGEVDELNIATPLPLDFPVPDEEPNIPAVDWAWQFDPLATPGRRIKIVDVQPSGDNVKFVGVDDNAGYYLSENNPFAYTPPQEGALLVGIVLDIFFTENIAVVSEDLTNITVSWTTTANNTTHRVNWAINGVPQITFQTQARNHTFQARTFDVITYKVTPIGSTVLGTSRSATYRTVGLSFPLPPVTGLTSIFRDGLTVLKWDPVTDPRDPAYEIRLGSSWTNAQTMAVVRQTEVYSFGDGLYWVAARFATPWGLLIYGEADSLLISGGSLVRNVIATTNEHPSWTGDLIDGAYIYDGQLTLAPAGDILALDDIFLPDDLLWTDGCAPSGIYETATANIIDIGYVSQVKIDFQIESFALNFNENILALEDVFIEEDLLNDSNRQFYSVQPQIRFAGEDGIYGNWVDYVPSVVNARYFDVRLVLSTTDPYIVPFVTEFTWSVDVPDLLQKAENVTIPTSGATITYAKEFHAVPNVQIAVFDAINGDRYVLTNSTNTSFDIQLFNASTAVQRNINWVAQGY